MNLHSPLLNSLRRKIVFGYGAVAALVVGLSIFSLMDMRLLEAQIAAGERVGQLFGITLEIRRFEKNFFLYHEATDLDEHRAYLAQARQLLTEHGILLESFEKPARVHTLRETIDTYARLMAAYAGGENTPAHEARIRQAGKEIVTITERWARAERALLQEQLARHRQWLLASIAVVVLLVGVLGQWLARRVARPLRQLEDSMAAVAAGRLTKLEITADDREIASLTRAFNLMLQQLELRQRQLLHAEKLAALGTLLSGVAHELNNPLSNISSSCQILAEEVGASRTAFEAEMIAQIDTETWRARRIVRSLLDYARDRSFQRAPLPLAPLVAESLRLIKGQIPARASIETTIPDDLVISGDKQRLQQVLFNLIGNALAALEGAGEIVITAQRRSAVPSGQPADMLTFGQCDSDGPLIEIELRDNGHGIAPENLPRIFDPFFTTKEVGQGLGLGLFIVFEIVSEHGGAIAVRSQPGEGTTFRLYFPAKDPHPHE